MQRVCLAVGSLARYASCSGAVNKFISFRVDKTIKPFASLPKSFFRTMPFTAEERGSLNSKDYCMYFKDSNGRYVSPFHDIPLYPDRDNKEVVNMVVEIPRWTNHKMEISTKCELNPIKQDVKNDKPRFVKNVFPHHGYIWNYGALPQTWEDPNFVEKDTGTKGDKDPLDACEIGQTVHKRGEVIQVKPLGVMCLVDEGETDWKLLCIDVKDPLADQLNDVDDIEKHMPGFIAATREWFQIYKMPDGKPKNEFGFQGKALDKKKTLSVIQEANEQWEKLVGNPETHGLSCKNLNVAGSPHLINSAKASEIASKAPPKGDSESLPADVDKCYFVRLNESSNL